MTSSDKWRSMLLPWIELSSTFRKPQHYTLGANAPEVSWWLEAHWQFSSASPDLTAAI
jgi:hypothetical protein